MCCNVIWTSYHGDSRSHKLPFTMTSLRNASLKYPVTNLFANSSRITYCICKCIILPARFQVSCCVHLTSSSHMSAFLCVIVYMFTSTPLHIFIFPTPAHLNFYFNIIILPTSSVRSNGLHYIEKKI
jgi:hypothetical protein